jgi:hypothetical protein
MRSLVVNFLVIWNSFESISASSEEEFKSNIWMKHPQKKFGNSLVFNNQRIDLQQSRDISMFYKYDFQVFKISL